MINKFDDYSYSAIRDIVVDKLSTTNWIRTIDALRPNDSLTVDISSPEWIDLYLSRMDQFKEIIKESVFILKNQKLGGLRAESIFKNMKVLLISENEIEMDEIKAEKTELAALLNTAHEDGDLSYEELNMRVRLNIEGY